jgi:Fibronectin type III domain
MAVRVLGVGSVRARVVVLLVICAAMLVLVAPAAASAATVSVPTTGQESYNSSSPDAGLVISQFDPDVSTTTTDGYFENSFIQILNASAQPVQLQGLSLQDFGGSGLTTDEWGSSSGGDSGPIELASNATPPAGGCTTNSGPVDQTGCLQPGQHYLLTSQAAAAGTNPYPLTADQTFTQGFGVTAPETAAATSKTEGSADAYLFLVAGTSDIGSDTKPQTGASGQSTGIIDAVATDGGYTAGTTPLFGTSTGPVGTALSTTGMLQRADGGCTDTGANQSDWSEVTAEDAVPSTLAGIPSNSSSPFSPCSDSAAQVSFTAVPNQVSPGTSFTVKVADETVGGTVVQGDSTSTATLTASEGGSPVSLSCVDANNASTTNGTAAMAQGYATFTCTVPAGTAAGTLTFAATATTSTKGQSYMAQSSTLPGGTATTTVSPTTPTVVSGSGTVNSGLVIDTLDTAGGDGDAGYMYDFVSLFNAGSSPVSLQGLSIQYDQQSNEEIDHNGSLACEYGWTSFISTASGSCASSEATTQAAGKEEALDALPDVVVQPGQSFLVAAPGQNESAAADLTPLPSAPDATWNPTGFSSTGQRIQLANNLIALVDGTTAENLSATTTPAEPVVDSFTDSGENAGITESFYDPGVTYIRGEAGPYISASRIPYRVDNGCQNTNNNQDDFIAAPPLEAIADGPDTGDNVAYVPQNQIADMSDTAAPCAAPTQVGFTIQPPSTTVPTSSMSNAFTVQVSSETSAGAVASQDNSTTVTLGITPMSGPPTGVNGSGSPQLTCVNSNAAAQGTSAPTLAQELSGNNGPTGTQVTDNSNGTVSLQVSGGQATLDCSVDTADTGYTLTASGSSGTYGTLVPATSKQFSVTAPSNGFSANSTQGLVVSQVSNGGGEWFELGEHLGDDNNWDNSFVELFNSSSQPISLNGLSLQFFGDTNNSSAGGDATGTSTVVDNDLQSNMQYETSDGGGFPTAFDLHNVTLAPGQHYLVQGIDNYEAIEDGGYQASPLVSANGGTYPASDFNAEQNPLPVSPDQSDLRFEDSPEEGSMWLLVDGTTPMASVDLENPATDNLLSDQTIANPVTTGPTVDQPVIDSLTQAGSDGAVVPGVTFSTGFPGPAQATGGEDEGYAYNRVEQGCQDTQNNALDFSLVWSTGVTPQDMSSPLISCSQIESQSQVAPGLVIAGAYGGGGQSASYYANDFVELENSSQKPISLVGDSLQYFGTSGPGSPANGNTPAVAADDYQSVDLVPNATDTAGQCSSSTTGPVSQTGCLQPGQYYLVSGAGASLGDGQPIAPVPDQTAPNFSINWSPTADADCPNDLNSKGAETCDDGGMLILANTTNELTLPDLPSNDQPGGAVIDALGAGTPLWSVGSPITVPNDADGDFRNSNGCADTNNNSGDFTEDNAQHSTLANSNTPATPCAVSTGGTPIFAFGYTPSPMNTSGSAPVADGETENPAGIAVGPDGTTYLANTNANTVLTLPLPTSSALATTFAGSFTGFGESGDGGLATNSTLSKPTGIAVDSAGNVFISDTGDNVVREVNATTGDISTVAGDGTAGFSGDGGQGTAAELNTPEGLAVSGSGSNETLYIADSGNDVIRALNVSTGVITTLAGQGQSAGYAGDGGPATSAELNQPMGVAVDSQGNLYIADSGNDVIREVFESGGSSGAITTVAGDYAAYAASGYTPSDSGNGGPATSAQLDDPQAIAVDSAGDIFIADTYDNAIREVSAASGNITLVSDNPPTDPEGLAIDPSNGDLLVASAGSNDVTIISGGIDEGSATATGVDPSNQLAFTGEPGGSVKPGQPFTVQVSEENGSGSVSGSDSSTQVSLGLLSPVNSTPGTLSCGSGNSATLNAGVASFTCTASGPGKNYELEATTGAYEAPAESTAFDVDFPADQPTDVSATGASEGATIKWHAVSGATGYDVYDATASGAELASNPNDAITPSGEIANTPVATVSGADSTSATISKLADGQPLDFVVQAVTGSGNSQNSQEVTATPLAVPTSVQASASNGSATVSWQPSEGATGYTVLVSTASGQEASSQLTGCTVSGQDTTSCTVNNLGNGTEYFFEVEATNTNGASSLSSEANTTPSTVPDAPTGVAGETGNGQVTVTWNPASNGGSAVTGYSVYASTTSGAENTSGTPACTSNSSGGKLPTDSCVITGLTNGTPEFFEVVATNTNGNSAASTEVSQTPSTVPDAPTGVSATAVGGDVQINWTAPNDGGSAITGYEVYDATATGGESQLLPPACSVTATDTSCTVSLTPGQPYFFEVVAVNANGTSAVSSEVTATPTSAAGAPTGVTATAGTGRATVNWTAPTNPSSPVAKYWVYESTTPGGEDLSGTPVCATATGTSCTVSNLANGTPYYFVVVADLQNGNTSASTETTATPIAAADGVTASAANASATVSWSAAAGASGYQVFDSTTPGAENLSGAAACTSTKSDCTVSGLSNGTTYYFEVVATNSGGSASPSSEVSSTPMTVPTAPAGVAVTSGNGVLNVSWKAPTADGGSPVTGYQVFVAATKGGENLSGAAGCTTTSATSCQLTGLTNGTAYFVVVVADNAAGASSASSEQSATPSTVPGAPDDVSITPGAGSATIQWNAPGNDGGSAVTGYEVFAATTAGGEQLSGTPTCSTKGTSCSITGLVPGTTYYFVVLATNVNGVSVASSQVGLTAAAGATAVSDLTASGGDHSATVHWKAPASSPAKYSVYVSRSRPVSTSGKAACAAGTETSCKITGLTNGKAYYIMVVTTGVGNTTAKSATVSVVPSTVPAAPGRPQATPAKHQVTLTWKAPNDEGSPISGYHVYEATKSGGERTNGKAVCSTSKRSCVVTGLKEGKLYYFIVTATNANGRSAASPQVSVRAGANKSSGRARRAARREQTKHKTVKRARDKQSPRANTPRKADGK